MSPLAKWPLTTSFIYSQRRVRVTSSFIYRLSRLLNVSALPDHSFLLLHGQVAPVGWLLLAVSPSAHRSFHREMCSTWVAFSCSLLHHLRTSSIWAVSQRRAQQLVVSLYCSKYGTWSYHLVSLLGRCTAPGCINYEDCLLLIGER